MPFFINVDLGEFVSFWRRFYDYPLEHLYAERISKGEFTREDMVKLFEWKNGMKLSEKKKAVITKIQERLIVVNQLKKDFSFEVFNNSFGDLPSIWKIYLLHTIRPQSYPIFDQHVCRAWAFLTQGTIKEIPTKNSEKDKSYFDGYLLFFNKAAEFPDLPKKSLDEALWAFGKYLKREYKAISAKECGETCSSIGSGLSDAGPTAIGPYRIDRIILCSADASPRAQSDTACEAKEFFPNAKWVKALANAAERSNCHFAILTTAHGLVHPDDVITPYDLHYNADPPSVQRIWKDSFTQILGTRRFDLMIIYFGGCPRQPAFQAIIEILGNMNIDALTFGKPNMCDIGKIDNVVHLVTEGTRISAIKEILRYPDKLEFRPCAAR